MDTGNRAYRAAQLDWLGSGGGRCVGGVQAHDVGDAGAAQSVLEVTVQEM